VPDPTPLLFIAAAAVAWVLMSSDAGLARPVVLATVMAPVAGAIVYFLSSSMRAALWALLGGAVLCHFYVELGGLKARPEHILIGLLCVAALIWRKHRTSPLRWITADYLLLAYIGMNLFSSLAMSVAPGQTLKWAVQQTLVILAYFLMRMLANQPQSLRYAVRGLVAVGSLEGAYAVVCFYSNLLFNTSFGVDVGQYGDFPGTYGTLYEANILGAFSAVCLVMALVLYFRERRRRYLAAVALTYTSMVIALSRAAIIASAVAVVVLFFAVRKKGIIDTTATKKLAITLLVTSIILGSAIVPLYIERFQTVEVSDISADPDTAVRIVTVGMALDDILQHPIAGNGTASFQLLVSNRELGFTNLDEMGTWIGNVEARVLHDTGVIGLAILGVFLLYLALPAWKLLRKEDHPELLALMLGALVYSLTFQTTEGTLLAFSWVHLGLIGCAVSIYYPPKAFNVGASER
jgi:hypothetical protein